MTFWSSAKLRRNRSRVILSDEFPEQIDCSAYTLRMGAEAYVTPYADERDPHLKVKQRLEVGQQLAIPAGQFAFLLSEEKISIPHDALGFISMKSGTKFRGLVNISGFHVDPGYSGRLVFSVFNAGPARIVIERGQPLFLLWIAELDSAATVADARSKPGFDEIPPDLVANIQGRIYSAQSLSERIDELDRKMSLFMQKWTIYASIAVVILTVAIQVGMRYMFPGVPQQSTQMSPQQPQPTQPTPAAPPSGGAGRSP